MPATSTPSGTAIQALKEALRAWWNEEQRKWIDSVEEATNPDDDTDLWDDMPVVESKQVARSGKLFEEHLGIKLDVKLIRAGGYNSIDDVIADLVPKMVAKASPESGGSA